MIEAVESWVDALRQELRRHGEMLRLLDHQRQFIKVRPLEEVLRAVATLETQSATIKTARAHREKCQREFARLAQQPDDAGFSILIPLVQPEYRPLVKALVNENKELLFQVRHRAGGNRLLLKRAMKMMQDLLDSLPPTRETAAVDGNDVTRAGLWRP